MNKLQYSDCLFSHVSNLFLNILVKTAHTCSMPPEPNKYQLSM